MEKIAKDIEKYSTKHCCIKGWRCDSKCKMPNCKSSAIDGIHRFLVK